MPVDLATVLQKGDPVPSLFEKEKTAFAALRKLYTKGVGYCWHNGDPSATLVTFFLDKFNDWTYSGGDAGRSLTKDEMLDEVTLYWLTNTGTSAAQIYWEKYNNFSAREQTKAENSVSVATTVFPGEIYQTPRIWAENACHERT